MSTKPLPDEFADILLKLRQADDHAEAFSSAAKEFWKSATYDSQPELDRKGIGIYRVTRVDSPPPELAIHISEAAHHLRSSLDHLMWLLARPTTTKEESNVQFPLVRSWPAFRGQHQTKTVKGHRGVRHMMPGVPRGVRTLVERLQPYHRRKWPETALLGQLQAISNWDKHRTLMTTAGGTVSIQTTLRIVGRATFRYIDQRTPILKPGAVLARFEVADFDNGTEVYMKPITTLVPIFDPAMPPEIRERPVYTVLHDCAGFIRTGVLPMFVRFF